MSEDYLILKKYGIENWTDLLEIAEKINPPEEQTSDSPNWCTDVSFDGEGGWKVFIFYDCGEIDYIAYFVTPCGENIDFWEWDDEHPWRNYLMNWRGVGDLDRLLNCD
jgi:hypothetical protein